MKVKKMAGVLLSIVTALVILLLCVFLFWLGPTVKLVAEKVGSKALGTPLTINKLTINPRNGIIHMSNFAIANPDTYGRSNAVSLASLDVSIDMGSVFTRTVVVHEVSINSPYFIYEQSAATDNIQEFILSIQEFMGYDPAAPPLPPDPKKEEKERRKKEKKAEKKKEKGPKIVIVEALVINDVQVHLANTEDPHLDIDVAFEQLALSMTNGTATLKNLRVGNPALLDTPNLFTLDAVDIAVDPASIYSEKISIRDVQIIRPYAYLEHNPQADTVSEFMKIAEQFTTKIHALERPAVETPAESKPEASVTGTPPVELHNLLVDDIQIKLLDTTVTNASSEPRMLAGIRSVSVRLVDGHLHIKEISVPSPEGFIAGNLFHLANIDIVLEPGSVFSTQTVIQKIFINSPTINLEQTQTGGNASELKDTLMGFVPPAPEPRGVPTPEEAPQTGERPEPIPLSEQAVVLQTLIVTNFAIHLSLPIDSNAPAADFPIIEGTLERVSLSKLNPLHQKKVAATNGTPAVKTPADGPLKLIAFNVLVAQPLEGTVQITNLQVSNLKGFANEHLATIEQFRMEIDPDSLRSDTLLIRDILIAKPRISFERRINTDNIKALQIEIDKAATRRKQYADGEEAPAETEPSGGQTEPSEDKAAGHKVIIEHLLVDGGLVRAKLSALPSAPIPLPNIEMKDLGKKEGGTSLGEAMSKIGVAFYDAIIGSVSSATGFAGDALKGAGALTFGTLSNVTGRKSGETEGKEGMLAEGDPSQEASQTAEPAEEKKPRRRLFRRGTGRFF